MLPTVLRALGCTVPIVEYCELRSCAVTALGCILRVIHWMPQSVQTLCETIADDAGETVGGLASDSVTWLLSH